MLRAPVSRMDILTPQEIALINRSSSLVSKYSQTIDRESAYEILNRKIEIIGKTNAEEQARKEWENERGGEREMRPTYSPARTSMGRSSRRSAASPVVKVLTSATFIRGVLGILKKVM
jgi:hypothetical protein